MDLWPSRGLFTRTIAHAILALGLMGKQLALIEAIFDTIWTI